MTLSEALKLARRWWWILIIGPVVGALAAYFISEAMTPIYRATATLLIQQSQVPGAQNYQDLLAAQQQTTTYSHLLSTSPVLDAAAKELGIAGGSDAIKKQISVSPVPNTQLVTVSVRDPIPERAATIANTVVSVFIEQTKQQQSSITGSSLKEIQQNLDQAKKQIDDTAAQIAQLEATPNSGVVNQAQITGLQQQLSQFQTNYGSLLEAQQNMAIAQAQVGVQTSVAEPAKAPTSPVEPRVMVNTALGGLLSFLMAIGLVALVGYFDNTIKTSEDLRETTGGAALGSIPITSNLGPNVILQHPRSAASEGFRALRTNLQFVTSDEKLKVLAITSIRPAEGKSTVSANLALVLAQGGERVLLVDADLRKPRQHHQFAGLNNRVGLTNLLRGTHYDVADVVQHTGVPNLRVVTSGPLPGSPADTLYVPRMRQVLAELKQDADIVLVDTPPLGVSDPITVAGIVDGVLLVVGSGRNRKHELVSALERIGLSGAPVVGVVLNRVNMEGEGYYYDYPSDSDIMADSSEASPVKSVSSPVSSSRRFWARLSRSAQAGKR